MIVESMKSINPFAGFATILLLSWIVPKFADGLVLTKNANRRVSSTSMAASLPDSRRIFVGGISMPSNFNEYIGDELDGSTVGTEDIMKSLLNTTFSQYGPIETIDIHGIEEISPNNCQPSSTDSMINLGRRKRQPFAFVTFQDKKSAEAATSDDTSNVRHFQTVKSAIPMDTKKSRDRNGQGSSSDRKNYREMASDCNLILQCSNSHQDRLVDFLHSIKVENSETFKVSVVGSFKKKAEALLFVKVSGILSMNEFIIDYLDSTRYLQRAIKKIYNLDSDKTIINSHGEDELNALAEEGVALLERATENNSDPKSCTEVIVRIKSFPPSIARKLAAPIDTILCNKKSADDSKDPNIILRPTNATHSLSIIQLGDGNGKNDPPSYLLGVSRDVTSKLFSSPSSLSLMESDERVSRAYFKLQEAFDRYPRKHIPEIIRKNLEVKDMSWLEGSIAIDCGAAPGGWSAYLAEAVGCKTVYSVDPGALSPTVLALDSVHHLPIRIDQAIQRLVSDEEESENLGVIEKFEDIDSGQRGTQIGLWVSDMCLHNISEQIDWLFLAQGAGLLSKPTFFVLTLKCNRGHSKASYDSQVNEEVKRLDGLVEGLQALHLFSNRNGERTVMGFLK